MQRKHSSEKKFDCSNCGLRFKTTGELLQHSRSERLNKCSSCDVELLCKLLLDRHQKEFHGNVLKCHACHYQTKSHKLLNKHRKTHVKPVACTGCEKFVHQMQHRHGIQAATPDKTTFDCDKCDRKCSSKIYLKCHQRNVHKVEEAKCKVCGRICRNRHLLQKKSQKTHREDALAEETTKRFQVPRRLLRLRAAERASNEKLHRINILREEIRLREMRQVLCES